MLNHETSDFDLFTGQTTPYLGFGALIHDSKPLEREIHEAATTVRQQLRDTFEVKLENGPAIPKELDGIVKELWDTGWNPQERNINLFTRDLGLILIETTLDLMGGDLVFRSRSNFIHCSIFWSGKRVEAFPFHKTSKCLLYQQGESMAYFVRGLAHQLEMKDLLRRESGL